MGRNYKQVLWMNERHFTQVTLNLLTMYHTYSIYSSVLDPHTFYTDPLTFGDAEPDPDPGLKGTFAQSSA